MGREEILMLTKEESLQKDIQKKKYYIPVKTKFLLYGLKNVIIAELKLINIRVN